MAETQQRPVREYLRTAELKPPWSGYSPAGRAAHLDRLRERYATDPEWRERKMAANRERYRARRELERAEKLAVVEARRAVPLRAGRRPRTQPAEGEEAARPT